MIDSDKLGSNGAEVEGDPVWHHTAGREAARRADRRDTSGKVRGRKTQKRQHGLAHKAVDH